MRQLLYFSDSLVGGDIPRLDQMMVQSQRNNQRDDITGLLWTDRHQFAQVIEGAVDAIGALMARICADTRHRNVQIVQDLEVGQRQFGYWSMVWPSNDTFAITFEQRMLAHLAEKTTARNACFREIIKGSRPAH